MLLHHQICSPPIACDLKTKVKKLFLSCPGLINETLKSSFFVLIAPHGQAHPNGTRGTGLYRTEPRLTAARRAGYSISPSRSQSGFLVICDLFPNIFLPPGYFQISGFLAVMKDLKQEGTAPSTPYGGNQGTYYK